MRRIFQLALFVVLAGIPGFAQNLYNPAATTANAYIDGSSCAPVTGAGYTSSDFIPVTPGATYSSNASIVIGAGDLCFYNSSQTKVSTSGGNAALRITPNTFTVPTTSSIASLRFASQTDPTTIMLVAGSTVPSSYVPYGSSSTPTISFSVGSHVTTDAPFTVSATSNSAGAITYIVTSGPATISGATVTLTGSAGTIGVLASQAANGSYASGSKTATFTVAAPSGTNLYIAGTSTANAYVDAFNDSTKGQLITGNSGLRSLCISSASTA